MKPKIVALSVALAVFLPAVAPAKTLRFPKDDPQFAVTFTNDWKAEITNAGIISAQPKGAGYAISIFPVVATNASDAIEETEKEVEKRFQNIKSNEPVEFKNANNIKFLERDYTGTDKGSDRTLTGTDKGSDRTLAIVAFSPDGKNYYALFQVGTPEADKQYTEDVVAIVKSIKSLKASRGDDEDDE